jgi:hypothetical protein
MGEQRNAYNCQDHWSITRELQQRVAVVEKELEAMHEVSSAVRSIERHIAAQNGSLPRMSEEILRISKSGADSLSKIHSIELALSKANTRVTLLVALVVPVGVAIGAAVAKLALGG